MGLLGLAILVVLLCWMFLGKSKQGQQPSSFDERFSSTDLDHFTRFIKLLGSGNDVILRSEFKEKWPVFGAALFVHIRDKHYLLRTKLSVVELSEYTKPDFFLEDLRSLAHLAASQGWVSFKNDDVDLEATPSLNELLERLFN
jgi:hypothetical protein